MDLVFDAAHGRNQILSFGAGGVLDLRTGLGGLGAGYSGTGSIRIADGRAIGCFGYACLGYHSGADGTATVTGEGSEWIVDNYMYVGYNGTGTLSVENGGKVSNTDGLVGAYRGSTGTAVVAGAGSTWTSENLRVGNYGAGTLTIEDGGKVSCAIGTIGLDEDSSGSVEVAGAGSSWAADSFLIVGGYGTGALTVESGGNVSSMYGEIGYRSGSSGTVTITGVGSNWADSGEFNVGWRGTGVLKIENGGALSSGYGCIGKKSGASGSAAIVTDAGSRWSDSGPLYVGYDGTGTLRVKNGGTVTAESLAVGSGSAINLNVTGDGMVVLGNASTVGGVGNDGDINLYADAFLAAKTYAPITEYAGRPMTWDGAGLVNAIGGTWHDTSRTFIVAATDLIDAGTVATLTTGQRLLISDATTGESIGVCFGAVTANADFAGSLMSDSDLSGLALSSEESVLSAWSFDTDYSDSALLSLDIGDGWSDLNVWHYSDGDWTLCVTGDLAYDNGIASFTVAGFSGYAVTAIPEPATLSLLAFGSLVVMKRRK